MTDADDALSVLFREGPTPDRDEAFAAAVMVDVARLRRRANLALSVRIAGGGLVLGGLVVGAQWTGLDLPRLAFLDFGPEILAVPAPMLAMGALAMIVATLARRLRRTSLAG